MIASKPMDIAKTLPVAAVLSTPMMAGATEGTNEIFGVNYDAIYLFSIPTITIGHGLGLLFKDWEESQDNSDFFDELPNTPL
mmetsp:Transcript_11906/g.27914  ORF Transcript_11906/g.27914 Transcript_11906/m.27914 type:complete len:82 (-) Transcript_11906:239-484(-)